MEDMVEVDQSLSTAVVHQANRPKTFQVQPPSPRFAPIAAHAFGQVPSSAPRMVPRLRTTEALQVAKP
ncbi:hypothetical protein SAMN04487823_101408 [Olsenella sp. kh2p3]|jgi:hypothetical protein|nr:hypothetical protein SAMN04487823_101408 [Olsenella sp. kh2p3]